MEKSKIVFFLFFKYLVGLVWELLMYVVPAYTNIILIVKNTTYIHIVPKKRKTLHIVGSELHQEHGYERILSMFHIS